MPHWPLNNPQESGATGFRFPFYFTPPGAGRCQAPLGHTGGRFESLYIGVRYPPPGATTSPNFRAPLVSNFNLGARHYPNQSTRCLQDSLRLCGLALGQTAGVLPRPLSFTAFGSVGSAGAVFSAYPGLRPLITRAIMGLLDVAASVCPSAVIKAGDMRKSPASSIKGRGIFCLAGQRTWFPFFWGNWLYMHSAANRFRSRLLIASSLSQFGMLSRGGV